MTFMRMHLRMMIECGGRVLDPKSGRDVALTEIFTKE
jgi:hypothetical protein